MIRATREPSLLLQTGGHALFMKMPDSCLMNLKGFKEQMSKRGINFNLGFKITGS